jgi:hypothetical protein
MIGVLCPSRGKPEGLKRLIGNVQRTAQSAEVLAYIDEDEWDSYKDALKGTQYIIGPRVGLVASVNALVQAFPSYSTYILAGDDVSIGPKGWDVWLERQFERFPGRLGVVSAHHNGWDVCNFPALSREWIATVGHFAWPLCKHYTFDTIIQVLGEATDFVHSQASQLHIEHPVFDEASKREAIKDDALVFLVWYAEVRKKFIASLNAKRAASEVPVPLQ